MNGVDYCPDEEEDKGEARHRSSQKVRTLYYVIIVAARSRGTSRLSYFSFLLNLQFFFLFHCRVRACQWSKLLSHGCHRLWSRGLGFFVLASFHLRAIASADHSPPRHWHLVVAQVSPCVNDIYLRQPISTIHLAQRSSNSNTA
jgi:hypothetical protein